MNRRQLRARCTLESLASQSNLIHAADKAKRHKSRRPGVEAWWLRREREINRLRSELLTETWRPSGYRFFTIHEPKRRLIAAAPFGDRVVHHALCNVMQPLLERRFIARSFSCQIGKGTTAAREVFGNDKDRLWDLRAGIVRELARIRLKLAIPKSRLLSTREGVPFCGFRFLPGLQPRILGATKRRFETRRHRLYRTGMPMREIGVRIYPKNGNGLGSRGDAEARRTGDFDCWNGCPPAPTW